MTVSVLPYLAFLFLGSTIDRRNLNSQEYYHDDTVTNITVIVNSTVKEYKVLEETFPYSFYGFPVDWSFLYKFDQINSMYVPFSGPASLLKRTSWQKHEVTIVFRSLYRTVDVSLIENEAVMQDWRTATDKMQTHYVDTLRYGAFANLIVGFKCDNIDDVPVVRERVISILGESGELTSDIKNKWEEVQEAVFDKGGLKDFVWTTSSWSSAGYAIFPKGGMMGELDQILNIDKMGTGNGSPMYMELKPLHAINDSFPELKCNDYLVNRVAKMIRMIDDVQNTIDDIKRYERNGPYIRERSRELGKLSKIVKKLRNDFRYASSKVNIFAEEEDPDVTAAMQSYVDGLQEGAPSYFSTYLNILKKYENVTS